MVGCSRGGGSMRRGFDVMDYLTGPWQQWAVPPVVEWLWDFWCRWWLRLVVWSLAVQVWKWQDCGRMVFGRCLIVGTSGVSDFKWFQPWVWATERLCFNENWSGWEVKLQWWGAGGYGVVAGGRFGLKVHQVVFDRGPPSWCNRWQYRTRWSWATIQRSWWWFVVRRGDSTSLGCHVGGLVASEDLVTDYGCRRVSQRLDLD